MFAGNLVPEAQDDLNAHLPIVVRQLQLLGVLLLAKKIPAGIKDKRHLLSFAVTRKRGLLTHTDNVFFDCYIHGRHHASLSRSYGWATVVIGSSATGRTSPLVTPRGPDLNLASPEGMALPCPALIWIRIRPDPALNQASGQACVVLCERAA
ncbi:hypothetical protein [Roseomonas xinghualingensis]|uniref:hypothetical protein n=1 Tax=Roseomonas xinghualingensis TaxID=2986475 RepID=UPI0021F0C44F|nr:hypothetical protein [Roseomonas sp. SXEYE001]